MKKILYVISNPFSFSRRSVGGNISSASGVVNGFLSLGYSVDIVSDSPIPTLEKNTSSLKTVYYPFANIRSLIPTGYGGIVGKVLSKIDSLFFQLSMKLKIRSLISETKYDFCYVRVSYNGHAISKILKKNNLDLVSEVNKPLSMAKYNNNSLSWPHPKELIKIPRSETIQYNTSTLITIDSSLRAKWVKDYVNSSHSDKIIINPNGVDTEMFSPKTYSAFFKTKFNLSKDQCLIGVASSFRWYNDIDEMCRIFRRVFELSRKVKFLIITGDSNKKKEIIEILKRYGIDDIAEVLLQIPFKDMPKYLNCCDILISHFNFHGKWPHNCSIKHLEYLSLGKPVVATNVGEVNFAVEDHKNGFLVEEGDVEGFAKVILKLSANKSMRIRMGDSGRLKAINELSWKQNTLRIIDALNIKRST